MLVYSFNFHTPVAESVAVEVVNVIIVVGDEVGVDLELSREGDDHLEILLGLQG